MHKDLNQSFWNSKTFPSVIHLMSESVYFFHFHFFSIFFFLFSLFLFLMKFLFWFRGFVVCKFLMNICMKMCRCFVFPHCPWNVCFIASFFLWLNIEEYCEGYATTLVNFHIFKSFFFYLMPSFLWKLFITIQWFLLRRQLLGARVFFTGHTEVLAKWGAIFTSTLSFVWLSGLLHMFFSRLCEKYMLISI